MQAEEIMLKALPKSKDCILRHIGQPIEMLQNVVEDDRYQLMVITRCSHCGVPIAGDRYATKEDEEKLSRETPESFAEKYQ